MFDPDAPTPPLLRADAPVEAEDPATFDVAALRVTVQGMRHKGIDDERIVRTLAFDGISPEDTRALIADDQRALAAAHRRSMWRWGVLSVALVSAGYLLRLRFGASRGLGIFLALAAVGGVVGLIVYFTSLFRDGGR